MHIFCVSRVQRRCGIVDFAIDPASSILCYHEEGLIIFYNATVVVNSHKGPLTEIQDVETPARQIVPEDSGLSGNAGSAVDYRFMTGYKSKRRRRNILSDVAEQSEASRQQTPNYDVGLGSTGEWPKVEGDDDFVFSVVNPDSYTALQKFCQKPVEYIDITQGCNCSGEHVCLKLEEKRVIATQSNPFSDADTFSIRSSSDWCAQNQASQVSGCSCEWRNTCDFVIYASPIMSISCALCP